MLHKHLLRMVWRNYTVITNRVVLTFLGAVVGQSGCPLNDDWPKSKSQSLPNFLPSQQIHPKMVRIWAEN